MSNKEFDVTFIGDGQLAQMSGLAGQAEGLRVAAIGSESSPAAQAGIEIIPGDMKNEAAILEAARLSVVLTLEAEHISGEAYAKAEETYGNTQPKPETLLTIYDKLDQKRFLESRGIPVAPFTDNLSDEEFIMASDYENKNGDRFVVKSRRGGFDGRGNLSVRTLDDPRIDEFKSPIYAERMMPFDDELAVLVARDVNGNMAPYPAVKTIHVDHICHTVMSPAPVDAEIASKAEAVAVEAVGQFSGAGVFAVEMFVVGNEVYVNEIAPRVHNSGHLTIEGNKTSQFTQHMLAVTGQELRSTERVAPAAVMVNILHAYDSDGMERAQAMPDTFVHLYGKEPREGMARKIGHLTALAHDLDTALDTADRAFGLLYPDQKIPR